MIFDMHVHSSLSPCSGMTVDEAVAAAGKRGLDGLCITDHGTMDIRHTISEGFQENGVCVVIGMEYSTPEGDFLVFGPFEEIPRGLPAHRLLGVVESRGGVAVAAHPFREKRPVSEWIVRDGLCRAVESCNGRNTPAENLATARWRRSYDLIACGGSDAHTIDEVGTFATRFFVPVRNRSDLIAALKSGRCRPEIPASPPSRACAPRRDSPAPSFRPAPPAIHV